MCASVGVGAALSSSSACTASDAANDEHGAARGLRAAGLIASQPRAHRGLFASVLGATHVVTASKKNRCRQYLFGIKLIKKLQQAAGHVRPIRETAKWFAARKRLASWRVNVYESYVHVRTRTHGRTRAALVQNHESSPERQRTCHHPTTLLMTIVHVYIVLLPNESQPPLLRDTLFC